MHYTNSFVCCQRQCHPSMQSVVRLMQFSNKSAGTAVVCIVLGCIHMPYTTYNPCYIIILMHHFIHSKIVGWDLVISYFVNNQDPLVSSCE